MKKHKWTVCCGKKLTHFEHSERKKMIGFIAENQKTVTNIKHYGRLYSDAISTDKEALRLDKISN